MAHLDAENTASAQAEKKSRQASTLRVTAPLGQTFGAALLLLVMLLAAGEIFARTRWFQSVFIAPGFGSPHRQYEIQLERLKKVVQKQGQIECIFMGNSMVWLGFDPVVFNGAYQKKTGEDLRCFNFGVDGLTTASAGPLAQILVDTYQPSLLIFGADPRDFAVPRNEPDTTNVLDTAWVQYRLGSFSLDGWLFEHSYLYRYRSSLRNFLRFQYIDTLTSWRPETSTSTRYGFRPVTRVATDINKPPQPDDDRVSVQYYFRILSNYQIQPENMAGFEHVLQQREKGVQILVVEIPFPATYLGFFTNGEKDYQMYRQQIGAVLEEHQVPLLPMAPAHIFTDDAWADYSHMNENGAQQFSKWLGAKIGELYPPGFRSNPLP